MSNLRKQKNELIREYILDLIDEDKESISTLAAKHFGISRQAINKHIQFLINAELIGYEGNTRNRRYFLLPIIAIEETIPVKGSQEDKVWRKQIRPNLGDVPENVIALFEYGFTEMVNNVIDHSGSEKMQVSIKRTARNIEIWVIDYGIGIFNKIYAELNLDDPMHAILELAKGKLTTDPEHHTGEGIFFSSRMFDQFSILSGYHYFSHRGQKNEVSGRDWFLEDKEDNLEGTAVVMTNQINSSRTTKEVFDYYMSQTNEFGFSKTHVPVILAKYGDENLVSRSQAKRLLARFDKFEEIVLDFDKVDSIGQAFADEIFRVFQLKNPKTELIPININEQVSRMINKAIIALRD